MLTESIHSTKPDQSEITGNTRHTEQSFLIQIATPRIGGYQTAMRVKSHIPDSQIDYIESFSALLETVNPVCYSHSERVSRLSEYMGRAMSMSETDVSMICTAALLHDIGKVVIPNSILGKPGRLTDDERIIVRNHPIQGACFLNNVEKMADVTPIIMHHHERYDGRGYPGRLKRGSIPIGARIVSITDAYDAMTGHRHYRKALSHQQAVKELRFNAGTQFDPELVDVFCEVVCNCVFN